MRIRLFFLAWVIGGSFAPKAFSQNLTGDWNGYFTQNDKTWAFTLNMKIVQSGNQLQGFARAIEPGGAFVRHEFVGQITGNDVSIQETRVVEDGGKGLWSWCIKLFTGKIRQEAGQYIIEGGWTNDGGRYYQNGPQNSGSYNCPPGRFKISRPYTCGEVVSSRLVERIERWRQRQQNETSAQWLQRTSHLNTDLQFRQVLDEMSAELLANANLDWQYDQDAGIMTLRSDCFEGFQLRVPPDQSSCFLRNFRKADFRLLRFSYQPDTRSIGIDSVLLKNTCNEMAYAFPLPPGIETGDVSSTADTIFAKRAISITRDMVVSRSSIEVRIYDNGTIDGDIVSIYFNGQAIRTRQALTASPIRIVLQLDPNRENVLAVFAENLGTIPPNTAMMTVDDGQQTQQVPLSSTLQNTGAIRLRVKK